MSRACLINAFRQLEIFKHALVTLMTTSPYCQSFSVASAFSLSTRKEGNRISFSISPPAKSSSAFSNAVSAIPIGT